MLARDDVVRGEAADLRAVRARPTRETTTKNSEDWMIGVQMTKERNEATEVCKGEGKVVGVGRTDGGREGGKVKACFSACIACNCSWLYDGIRQRISR